MIIYNNAAQHLTDKINLPKIDFQIQKFPDGEIYIKLNQFELKEVWILVSTQSPAENLLELFFLLDALKKSGTQKINLLFTYFGYARQSSQNNSTEFICNILKTFNLNKIYIINAHAPEILSNLIEFNNIIDFNFYFDIAQNYDVIAAPDKGAANLAKVIAQKCRKELIILEKQRSENGKIKINASKADLHNKSVLIVDDIISTGNTIIEAAQILKKFGAKEISVAATHGVFAPGAKDKINETEIIEKVYVTNTINQSFDHKIQLYDISQWRQLKKLMLEILKNSYNIFGKKPIRK